MPETANQERRRLRREAVQQEREARRQAGAESLRRRALGGYVFTGKARRGDALEIRFDFPSGIVVDYTDESDPTKGVVEKVEMQKMLMDAATSEGPRH